MMLNRFWTQWTHFLFDSDDTYVVHWGRFLIYGLGTIYLFLLRDRHPASFTDNWDPISFYQLFAGPFSFTFLETLRWIWLLAGLLAAFGVGFAVTATLCFLSATLMFGHSYNFGVVYHSTHLYVMCLGLMIWTAGNAPVGVRVAKMYVVYFFCYCGIQKLFYGDGLEWAFSDSFYIRLIINPQQTPFALWVMDQPLVISKMVAAYSHYIVEILAPLAFLGKRIGIAYFLIWSSFHFGITLTFGNHFLFWSGIFCYALFLPWKDICAKLNLPEEPRTILKSALRRFAPLMRTPFINKLVRRQRTG